MVHDLSPALLTIFLAAEEARPWGDGAYALGPDPGLVALPRLQPRVSGTEHIRTRPMGSLSWFLRY
jgi:hypothetical protein